jgi:hypothetical protein
VRDLSYLDFDLLVEPGGDAFTYQARVITAPSGQCSPVKFTLPLSELEIENFLLKIGHPRRQVMRGFGSTETAAIKNFGALLFDAVFHGEIRLALATSLNQAELHGKGLRVRLRLSGVPELATLPWEFLYDTVNRRFIALSEWTPLIRYMDLPGRVRPLRIAPPLQILVLIAGPRDMPPLATDLEWAKLGEALESLEVSGRVRLSRAPTGTLSALQRMLRRADFHVFHFIGHGGFDVQADDGVLAFEDLQGGSQFVSANDLGVLLHDHRTLRMAVLNTCEGARGGRLDPYSGTAQTLVRQGVPAVVAMQFEITDDAAILLAGSLYESIADGYPLDAAMADARKSVHNQPNPIEWATPVLYLRADDGRIFDVPSAATLPSAEENPDYVAAMRAARTGAWSEASRLLEELLSRHTDHQGLRERLAYVRRQQQLEGWDGDARQAVDQGRWSDATVALKQMVSVEPTYRSASDRLTSIQNIVSLQADLRRYHDDNEWAATIETGDKLRRLHVEPADARLIDDARRNLRTSAEDASTGRTHWYGRNRWLVVGATVVTALVIVTVLYLEGAIGPTDSKRDVIVLPGAASPLADDRLVFTGIINGRHGAWSIMSDGTSPIQIIDSVSTGPTNISRDRRTLVYVDTVTKEPHVIGIDGRGDRRLFRSVGADCRTATRLSWGPHDLTLALSCRGVDGGLYVLDLAGNKKRRLVEGQVDAPTYSPDGSLVAYYVHPKGSKRGGALYVVATDGSETVTELTPLGDRDADPAWSKDGNWLAFRRRMPNSDWAVFKARVSTNGKPSLDNPQRLTYDTQGWNPTWSPDGTQIAFKCGQSAATYGICVADAVPHAKSLVITPGPLGAPGEPIWYSR